MDSPWDDDLSGSSASHQEAEWSKISNDFTNAGYREGITAGKESSLQEGFDAGFADVGAPLGRELGKMRGVASTILILLGNNTITLPNSTGDRQQLLDEARDVSSQLSRIRFSDIMPPDIEAEAHAREHLQMRGEEIGLDEELKGKKEIETLEDMLEKMGENGSSTRPTADSVKALGHRLVTLLQHLGLGDMI